MRLALAVILIIMALAWGALIGWIAGMVTCAWLYTEAGIIQPAQRKAEEREPTEAELARREEERQQLAEDNKAFQAMLDYNASMAYGMAKGDKKG